MLLVDVLHSVFIFDIIETSKPNAD